MPRDHPDTYRRLLWIIAKASHLVSLPLDFISSHTSEIKIALCSYHFWLRNLGRNFIPYKRESNSSACFLTGLAVPPQIQLLQPARLISFSRPHGYLPLAFHLHPFLPTISLAWKILCVPFTYQNIIYPTGSGQGVPFLFN